MATLSGGTTSSAAPASISTSGITGGGNDGAYSWSISGEDANGNITLSVNGAASNVRIDSSNNLTADVASGGTTYITFRSSDVQNWTVFAKSNSKTSTSSVKFTRGGGGGH
ncbi:MAG: hypothetical protein IPJ76_18745 [Flavobacteriales bacterium]|nr:MAG: hypothetical protein IPJ76_18745 [Flavobacteriales bacterium]